jgi:hypothetical protein
MREKMKKTKDPRFIPKPEQTFKKLKKLKKKYKEKFIKRKG